MKHIVQDIIHLFVQPQHTIEHSFLKRKEKHKPIVYVGIFVVFAILLNLVDALTYTGGFDYLLVNTVTTLVGIFLFTVFLKIIADLFEAKSSFNDLTTVFSGAYLFLVPFLLLLNLKEAIVIKGLIGGENMGINVVLAVAAIISGVVTLFVLIKTLKKLTQFSLYKTLALLVVTIVIFMNFTVILDMMMSLLMIYIGGIFS